MSRSLKARATRRHAGADARACGRGPRAGQARVSGRNPVRARARCNVAGDRRLGYRCPSGWPRSEERQGQRRCRPGPVRRAVRELPRHVRREQPLHGDRRRREAGRPEDRPRSRAQGAGRHADRGHQAELCDHVVGLHQPRHAVDQPAVADGRPGLRDHGLCSAPQRDRSGGLRVERPEHHQGPDAESVRHDHRPRHAFGQGQARRAGDVVHEGLREGSEGHVRTARASRATSTAISPSRSGPWDRRAASTRRATTRARPRPRRRRWRWRRRPPPRIRKRS